jgi:hypothetical protein
MKAYLAKRQKTEVKLPLNTPKTTENEILDQYESFFPEQSEFKIAKIPSEVRHKFQLPRQLGLRSDDSTSMHNI